MYAIPAVSRRPVTVMRTSSSSVTPAPSLPPTSDGGGHCRNRLGTTSPRPREPQLAPHPFEVVSGAAVQALAGREVLHFLEERDQLGARGLEAYGLARRAAAEGGQRLVEPAPIAT